MKSILHFRVPYCRYNSRCKILLVILFAVGLRFHSQAQCAAGYTRDTINWDYLDFLHRSGVYGGSSPNTGLPFVTTAMAQTQYFSVAGNRITFTNTNSLPIGQNGAFYADITTHTGETGSYGVGEDIKFMPAASTTYSITFAFQAAVRDVKFSLYDVDLGQRIAVTALDGTTPVNITMASVSGSILSINNNGTTSANAKADAAVTPAGNTSSDGTVNVLLSGSVTSFTIAVSETTIKSNGPASGQDDGGFYLSDISACFANPSFPTNYYYSYTQPFTNQPAYFLANPQNLSVYMVSAGTGVADFLFSDPGVDGQKMNSLAYDPVNKWVYYVMDNYTLPYTSQPPENRKLKKYDFNTGSISTVISDLRTFGIPTLIQGVEFAGAAFYNGSLYLGIEESDGNSNSTGAESVVWKIDFDASGNATAYSQVFALPGDNGAGLRRHDWGDIIIKDGLLISHATYEPAALSSTNIYTHFNLETGTAITYSGDNTVAGQLGQTYNGNIYRVKNNLALYNNNGSVGATTSITVTSCSPAWVNDAGDASDPFKPKCDFGDAPASYDPVALSPAANQKACNNSILRIGSFWGDEWNKISSSDASGDDEEDGITTVAVMVSDGVPYNHVQDVTVLNNTGATAYLAGWLDYDADGLFEASEGIVMTVPSNVSPQTITLSWPNLTVAYGTPNSFLRIRLYSGPLTINDATGWLSDGETEDYPVISQSMPLMIRLLDFNATMIEDKNVLLKWRANADQDASGFQVERSTDQINWEKVGWININRSVSTADYSLIDQQMTEGKTYYRLKLVERSGTSRYSHTRFVQIDHLPTNLLLYPNPAISNVTISFKAETSQSAVLYVRSLSGGLLFTKPMALKSGENNLSLPVSNLDNGIYVIELSTPDRKLINRLTVMR